MMQFGMPTLVELPDIKANAELCRQCKLDFIEINLNLPQYQLECIDLNELLAIKNEYHLFYTLHMDEKFDPANFNGKVARAYLETAAETVELAKQLQAPVITMHMPDGVYFTLPDRKVYLYSQYKEEYLNKLNHFKLLCEKQIGQAALKICMENTGWHKFAFIPDGVNLLLQSPVFGLTYDTGHDFTNQDEPFFIQHQTRIRHMHLHDANSSGNHLPLGSGEINLSKKLDMAKQSSCRVVLEVKNEAGLLQSVNYLKFRGLL